MYRLMEEAWKYTMRHTAKRCKGVEKTEGKEKLTVFGGILEATWRLTAIYKVLSNLPYADEEDKTKIYRTFFTSDGIFFLRPN